jgi:hepatocyte growth factor-regulated tyrosine kinase substrate
MLEERLSHTYGQHNLGYGASAARPTSGMYPSLSQPQTGPSQVENFYTGNAAPSAPADYGPPKSGYEPYQQPSGPAYGIAPGYDRNQPPNTYTPQRTSSIQSYPSIDSQRNETYNQEQTPSAYQAPSMQQTQPPIVQGYNQPPMSPVSEVASYYHEPKQNFQQPIQSPPEQTPVPTQSSPVMYHQQPPTQPPNQLPQQQQQQPPTQQYPQQSYSQNQPQNYWQPQQATGYSQQSTQPTAFASAQFPSQSFPVAPTHQPQPKPVEEALIEL